MPNTDHEVPGHLTPTELSDLAQRRPDLWPEILRHPSCYDGLAEWIHVHSQAATPAAKPPPARRRRWLISVAVVSCVAVAVLGTMLLITARSGDDEIIERYDLWTAAIDSSDCDLYESLTTATFRDSQSGHSYSCEDWSSRDANWSTVHHFSYEVVSHSTDGDRAVLVVDERWNDDEGDPAGVRSAYTLLLGKGGWRFNTVDLSDGFGEAASTT